MMNTQFITAEVDLQPSPTEMQQAIVAEMQRWGEPLRWAITAVKVAEQKAVVEAIVIVDAERLKDEG